MDLINLQGVGPQKLNLLNKLGIYSTNDLVNYYPYKYNFYRLKHISDDLDKNDLVKVRVERTPVVNYIKKNFNRLSFQALSDNLLINVTIFNRAFLKSNLTVGKYVYVTGKFDKMKNSFVANDIIFNVPDNMIEPVYHLTNGLNNNLFQKLLSQINLNDIYDYVPEYINEEKNFISKREALDLIHFPKSIDDIEKARRKLVYEELFVFAFKILYSRKLNISATKEVKEFDINRVNNFIKELSFSLTNDQNLAINDILNDISSNSCMNRLIIGDVGSGKTIVSIIAMYANYLAGYQSAFMAPTEVLAIQHYNNLNKLLGKELTIELLVGSMTKSEKESVVNRLKNNEIDIVIGTHALIQDNVIFGNLGLVVTDEQHRFGVLQRKNLQEKGNRPDCLYMSATPIPRTLALALYGDLNVSYIKDKPMGRKPVKTEVVKEKDLKKVLSQMYLELQQNHQVFVVSPLIEENEDLDLKSVTTLKEKFEMAFNNKYVVGILHGKMSSKEKQAVMNDFKNNVINILISTTVVEVGVDIYNATMMVIFNAERFGLATIHQLRGRVGRNDFDCYCYLISNLDIERLKVLEESNDGFYISEKDLEFRKEGDLLGTRQSGLIGFKIANSFKDREVIFEAQKDCQEFINNKKYINSVYYNDIIKEINIMD